MNLDRSLIGKGTSSSLLSLPAQNRLCITAHVVIRPKYWNTAKLLSQLVNYEMYIYSLTAMRSLVMK